MSTSITQTSLSATMSADATVLTVVSATNIVAPTGGFAQKLYVINPDSTKGELMSVLTVNGTTITVERLGKYRTKNIGPTGNGGIGATVLIGPAPISSQLFVGPYLGDFQEFNPSGSTSAPAVSSALAPWVNVDTGEQWLYSSLTSLWVPGWNNPSTQKGVTANVASAAGLITPSGPLFHITGTAAITGFTLPTGFAGGSFRVIVDAVFTWTTANNIALASGTVVVGSTIDFTYDSNLGKFYPSTQV